MTRKALVGVVVVAAVAVGAAAAARSGSEPGPGLRALRAEPVASLTPPAARLESASELDGGSAMGKPVNAQLSRRFSVPASDAQASLRASADAARRAGWRVRQDELAGAVDPEEAGWIGMKRLRTGQAGRLSLTLRGGDGPRRELRVVLSVAG